MSNRYDCMLCEQTDIPYYNMEKHLLHYHNIKNQAFRLLMITPRINDRANPIYCFKPTKGRELLHG